MASEAKTKGGGEVITEDQAKAAANRILGGERPHEDYWSDDDHDSHLIATWARQELARREAEQAERAKLLNELLGIFNASDQERLKEVHEHDAEADKWKAEGDMYGWNFHKGMASGCTSASIIFFRVKRAIEKNATCSRP